jgi:hypothetical protein
MMPDGERMLEGPAQRVRVAMFCDVQQRTGEFACDRKRCGDHRTTGGVSLDDGVPEALRQTSHEYDVMARVERSDLSARNITREVDELFKSVTGEVRSQIRVLAPSDDGEPNVSIRVAPASEMRQDVSCQPVALVGRVALWEHDSDRTVSP